MIDDRVLYKVVTRFSHRVFSTLDHKHTYKVGDIVKMKPNGKLTKEWLALGRIELKG